MREIINQIKEAADLREIEQQEDRMNKNTFNINGNKEKSFYELKSKSFKRIRKRRPSNCNSTMVFGVLSILCWVASAVKVPLTYYSEYNLPFSVPTSVYINKTQLLMGAEEQAAMEELANINYDDIYPSGLGNDAKSAAWSLFGKEPITDQEKCAMLSLAEDSPS